MFSKACNYGIRATLYLAMHASKGDKIGTKEVAEALDIPKPFLAKILQQLAREGLISSLKGPGGGFYLTEKDLDRSLYAIVENIDGQELFTSCILGLPECSSESPCPLHVQAYAYREGLLYQLQHQTVRELARKIEIKNQKI